MAQTLTLATTIVQRETGRIAEVVFVPTDSLDLLDGGDVALALGVRRGFQIRNTGQLEDFLFASMVGRRSAWEPGSFNYWHGERSRRANTPEAIFAHQLATQDLVPVSSSPIAGTSLEKLMEDGQAWTATGDWALHHPLEALAIYIVFQAGIVITRASSGLGGGLGAGLYGAAELWVRERLRPRPRRRPPAPPAPPVEPPDDS